MKPKFKSRLFLGLSSIALALSAPSAFGVTDTYNTAGTFNWICPGGVTSIQVECWGGGGAGGSGRKDTTAGTNTSQNGAGGGGGAYARRISVPVTSGTTYTFTIPAAAVSGTNGTQTQNGGAVNGGNVQFVGDSAVTIKAAGGSGGPNAYTTANSVTGTTAGGAGGTVGNSIGDASAVFAGGSGFKGTLGAQSIQDNSSGGGGGGAGNAAAGGTAVTGGTGAAGGTAGGGTGGNGRIGANTNYGVGSPGATPGGGGGGGKNGGISTQLGGTGGLGQVKLTYTVPPNYKADNTDNLNLASSWNAFVPTAADVAEWESHVLGANATVLGADLTFSGVKISSPGGPVTINAGNTLTLGAATTDIDMSAATQDLTLNCPLALGAANVWDVAASRTLTVGGGTSGAFAVTKSGTGTLVLSGASTHTGNTIVSNGTLNLTGTLVSSAATLACGNSASTTVVNVSNDVTVNAITIANNAASNAAYNQTAGTVNVTLAGVGSGGSYVSNSGYGYFNLTGGTFKSNGSFSIGTNSATSNGVAYVGGTGILDWSGSGNQTLGYASPASLTVGPGGSVSRGSSANVTWLATNANSAGIVNIAGGSLDLGTAGNVYVTNTASATSVTINLAGGTLTMGKPLAMNTGTTGTFYANYAGGTLKASATLASSPMNVLTSVSTIFGPITNNNNASSAFNTQIGTTSNFSGGLTIDTNGNNMPYGNALRGVTGNGVKQADITVTGGSGYIGAPLVTFTGGTGTPASGYAVISGGAVTGIVITSPGDYTVDPTGVSLTGGLGAGGTAASVALGALTANAADSGLTKINGGTLTLSGANTYVGPTTVNGGTLQLNSSAATTPTTSSITVNSGTLGFTAAAASTLDLTGKPLTLGGGALAFDIGTTGVNDAITVNDFTLAANSSFSFNLLTAISNGNSYTLLTSANPIINSGPYTISGQTIGKLTLNPVINANTVTLTASLDESAWNQTGGGNWSLAGNWSGYVPTAAGDAALFGSAITGAATITVDSAQSVGYMRFDNANAYTIGSGSSSNLTLDNGAAAAYVVVNSGSHVIAENTALTSNASVFPATGTTLTVSGALSGAGSLNLNDVGTLVLSGTGNSYSGGTKVNFGTLKLSGAGTPGPAGSAVSVNSGALLDLNGTNQSIAFTAGTGAGIVANNSGSGTSTLTLATSPAANILIQDNTDSSSGKVAVVVAVSGTQGLSTSNSYSGGTTVNAGAYLYINPGGAGTGTINLTALGANGATSSGLLVNGASYANDISGAGYVHNNSNSGATAVTTTLTGNINTSGPFIFRAGTGITYDFAGNGTTSVLGGVIGSTTSMVNGAVATGSIIKSGTGVLTLTGTNVYTGSTTISGGQLIIDEGSISTSSNIVNNAALEYKFTTTAGTYANAITGSGSLTKSGGNSLNLSSATTNYTGATTINGGKLILTSTTAFASAVTVNASGTLQYSPTGTNSQAGVGAISLLGTLTYAPATNSFQTVGTSGANKIVTVSGGASIINISPGGTFTASTGGLFLDGGLQGSSALTVNATTNGFGLILRTAGSTYSGTMIVNGNASTTPGTGSGLVIGFLAGTANATLPSANLSINGTLELGNSTAGMGWAAGTFANLSGKTFGMNALNGTGVIVANMGTAASTRTLSVGNNGGTGNFSGIIADGTNNTLSFTKTGAGTQTLSGPNTYSGPTTVSDGSLILGSATALGTSAATVNGGSLDLGGQTITNTVSTGTSGTLTGSGSTGAATLAGSMTPGGSSSGLITMASASLASTSSIALQLAATGTRGTNYDAITVSSPLALDGTITVTLNGLTPAAGQSFDLIDSTGAIDVTNFTVATDLVLPALSGGLVWDTSNFANNGVISIANGDPYAAWSGGAAFKDDANGDGVKNGLAWLLGAANKDANALGLLPSVTQSGGDLTLTFDCLSAANRGTAVLNVQYSNDLGLLDLWTNALVPGVATDTTVNNVHFVTTAPGSLIHVVATIPSTEAAAGKLFGRLDAETP